jgi:hypothetical protein
MCWGCEGKKGMMHGSNPDGKLETKPDGNPDVLLESILTRIPK